MIFSDSKFFFIYIYVHTQRNRDINKYTHGCVYIHIYVLKQLSEFRKMIFLFGLSWHKPWKVFQQPSSFVVLLFICFCVL